MNRLQSYIQWQRRHEKKSDLSPPQCRLLFQHWVAYDRNCSREIDKKEHLICPLLCCRSELEDVQSCLHHLSNCPWLSNPWYWCPFCHRPELFIYGEDNTQNRVQRKESKLKRAVTFLKQLRRKTSSHGNQRIPPSHNPMQRNELATHPLYPRQEQELAELPVLSKISELPVPDPTTSPLSKLSLVIPLVPTFRYELPAPEPSKYYQGYTQALNNSSSNLALDSDPDVDGSASYNLVSALSPFDVCQEYSKTNASRSFSPHPSFKCTKYDISMSESLSLVAPTGGSELRNRTLQTVDASSNSSIYNHLSTQILVEDLRSFLRSLSGYWMAQLRSALGNRIPLMYTTDILFETGLRTLKQIYEGVLPRTFDEVFSMMHVVFASAWILHHNDASYPWDNLFHHMTRWHRAIVDNVEKDLFLAVVNVLWLPPEFPNSLNLAQNHLYSLPMPFFTASIQVGKSE